MTCRAFTSSGSSATMPASVRFTSASCPGYIAWTSHRVCAGASAWVPAGTPGAALAVRARLTLSRQVTNMASSGEGRPRFPRAAPYKVYANERSPA